MHGAARQPDVFGLGAHTPTAVMLRLLAEAVLHPLHDFRPMFYWPGRSACILETPQSHYKRPAPFAYRHLRKIQVRSDFVIAFANGGGQNDTARPTGACG